MLQRIQTVYLLGVVAIGVLMFFLPFAEIHSYTNNYVFDIWAISDVDDKIHVPIKNVMLVLLLNIISITTAFISIFLYKKRKNQLKLCKANILFMCILLAAIFFYGTQPWCHDATINYQLGAFLPIISIILTFLAHRAIKKDEELVRSMDRLR
ncbi:MAG: hypothetical protein COA57_05280 [Flavobacteriales bacterium]|nr:MAG: hypothetical protein COA57_05280 [Flavobacteriales bacterium]